MLTVCDDGCEDESIAEAYEWVVTDADEHHAETCSPFCGCSCCQSLSLESPDLHQLSVNVFDPSFANATPQMPEDPGHGIWQPPKI